MLLAKTVWAKIGGMLTRNHSNAPTDLTEAAQPRRLPPEIVEMVIANLKYDVQTLKSVPRLASPGTKSPVRTSTTP